MTATITYLAIKASNKFQGHAVKCQGQKIQTYECNLETDTYHAGYWDCTSFTGTTKM